MPYVKDSRSTEASKCLFCLESSRSAWSPPPHITSQPLHKFCRRWKLSSCAETAQVHRCFTEIACKLLAAGHRAEQSNKTIYPRTYLLSKYWRELLSSESFLGFRSVKVPFWASDCCLQTILSAELFQWEGRLSAPLPLCVRPELTHAKW